MTNLCSPQLPLRRPPQRRPPMVCKSTLLMRRYVAAVLGTHGAPDAVDRGTGDVLAGVEVAGVDRVRDEPHVAVGETPVDAAWVAAGGRNDQVRRITPVAAIGTGRGIRREHRVEGDVHRLRILPGDAKTGLDLR